MAAAESSTPQDSAMDQPNPGTGSLSSPSLPLASEKATPEASTPIPRPVACMAVLKPLVVETLVLSTKCWKTKEPIRLLTCIGKTKQSSDAKKEPEAAARGVGA